LTENVFKRISINSIPNLNPNPNSNPNLNPNTKAKKKTLWKKNDVIF